MNEIAKQKIGKLIGTRINSALAAKSITQKELAEKTNILPGTISYFCAGSRVPNAEQLISIAKALSVSSDYLYGLTDSMSTNHEIKSIVEYTGLTDDAIQVLHENTVSVREVLNLLVTSPYFSHLAVSLINYLRSDTAQMYAMDGVELLEISQQIENTVNNEKIDINAAQKRLADCELKFLTIRTSNETGNLMRTFPTDKSFWNALFLRQIEEDLKDIKRSLSKKE